MGNVIDKKKGVVYNIVILVLLDNSRREYEHGIRKEKYYDIRRS